MWRLAAVFLFMVAIFALWVDMLRPVAARETGTGEPELEVTLADTTPRVYEDFGYPAPIRNGTVFAGVPNDTDLSSSGGAVRIFSRNQGGLGNWGLVTSLTPEVSMANARFGRWVAVDNGRLLIGAPGEDHPSFHQPGAAYIFDQDADDPTNWQQVARLEPSILTDSMNFGFNVALLGDNAVIGAPTANISDYNSGAIFVFEREPSTGLWSETAALLDPFPGYAFLGTSVATNGDLILAGAPGKDAGGAYSAGAVLVFARNLDPPGGWSYTGQLEAPLPVDYSRFGSALTLHSDLVLVGAPRENCASGYSCGKVYGYQMVGTDPEDWPFLFSLVPDAIEEYMNFGNQLAINPQGDRLIVGAVGEDYNSGAVYVFDRDAGGPGNWGQVARIPGRAMYDQFGAGVDMDESGMMAIGERYGAVPGFNNAGALHLFCLNDDLEPNDSFMEAAPLNTGPHNDLQVCSGDEDYFAIDVPAGEMISATLEFIQEAGNLDMALYGPDFSLLRESSTTANGELIIYNGTVEGTYYLVVNGVDRAANRYNLQLSSQPAIPCSDDSYEENDVFSAGVSIPFGVITDLAICPADDDYFHISVPGEVSLSIEITFTHNLGDLNLVLYNADRLLVGESVTTTDHEAIMLLIPAGGDYYIRVYGVGLAANNYALSASARPINYLYLPVMRKS